MAAFFISSDLNLSLDNLAGEMSSEISDGRKLRLAKPRDLQLNNYFYGSPFIQGREIEADLIATWVPGEDSLRRPAMSWGAHIRQLSRRSVRLLVGRNPMGGRHVLGEPRNVQLLKIGAVRAQLSIEKRAILTFQICYGNSVPLIFVSGFSCVFVLADFSYCR